MKIEVSTAEIVDKVSILEIKLQKISDSEKVKSVRKEHDYLCEIMENELGILKTSEEYEKLHKINNILWDTENIKRDREKKQLFDEQFIRAARNTYIYNDERAAIKREINVKYNSNFIEEKEHKLG